MNGYNSKAGEKKFPLIGRITNKIKAKETAFRNWTHSNAMLK